MYNIIRFYNQNRKSIWRIILVIALAILVLQLLNSYVAENSKKKIDNTSTLKNNTNNVIISKDVISNKSSITGEKIENNKLKEDSDLIDEFISYCNSGDIENAYNLLSNDCKENVFPTIEDFKKIYYEEIFSNGNIINKIENWLEDIYKVTFTENMISTGKINNESDKQDYITIVNQDNEKKLNINGYIGKETINKKAEVDGIEINVVEENTFMDYVTFTYEVKNTTSLNIMLDPLDGAETMYIEDDNGNKYSAYTHELSSGELFVDSKSSKKIKIKYYSKFSSQRILKNINFLKIVENYRGNVEFYNKIKVEI